MNWIRENKFLFGYLVALAIGVGALGFLLFSAKGHYDDSVSEYQRHVDELNRLQRQPIFPNQKNLDRLAEQKNQVNTEVSKLAETLAEQQIPVEELTPEQFQDKLKASVTAVRAKAGKSNAIVKLPDKFFLGFDRYETAPPAKEAAAVLARELKAIEWICTHLIENRIAELRSLNREDLPEEKGRVRAQDKKGQAGRPAKAEKAERSEKTAKAAKSDKSHVVEKHRIEFVFLTDQAHLRQILNGVAGYKNQFFIPRYVAVKNENPKGPPREAEAAPAASPAAAADGAAPAPGHPVAPPSAPAAPASPPPGPASAQATKFIVGEEKIEVTLLLEMVDFSEVAAK